MNLDETCGHSPYKSKGNQVRVLHNNIVDKVQIFFKKEIYYDDIKSNSIQSGYEFSDREQFEFDDGRINYFCRVRHSDFKHQFMLIPKDFDYYSYAKSIFVDPFRFQSFDTFLKFVADCVPSILDPYSHCVSQIAFGSLLTEDIQEVMERIEVLFRQKTERFEDRKRVRAKGRSQYGATLGNNPVKWNFYDKLFERNDKRKLTLDGSKLTAKQLRSISPVTRVDVTISRDAIRDVGIDSIQDLRNALLQGDQNPLLFPFKHVRESSVKIRTCSEIIEMGKYSDQKCRRKCVPERFVERGHQSGWFQAKYEDNGLCLAKKEASRMWGSSSSYRLKQILHVEQQNCSPLKEHIVTELDSWMKGKYQPEKILVELPAGGDQ